MINQSLLKDAGEKSKINTIIPYLAGTAGAERRDIMAELPEEVKRVANYAADMTLPSKFRTDAIDQLGLISTREAFLALLELAANEKLIVKERDFALKKAREIR